MRQEFRWRGSVGESARCASITRHVWDLLDGELALIQVLALWSHLLHCRRCRRYLRFQQRLRTTVRDALREEPSRRTRSNPSL